ncbi:hypothetical protein F5878DRAFT_665148 [Lentinula raphanica]|uniref:Uncharacterized protein n=1 Tax=Lentinula raphanica TaxID=153919 RepID=A0AA38U979_9AGAR|nr:hypothetical protein F5878DRAFT_665148 [Lentinula raphanica]
MSRLATIAPSPSDPLYSFQDIYPERGPYHIQNTFVFLCILQSSRQIMDQSIPFVVYPRAPATALLCFETLKNSLPVVPFNFIPSLPLPLATVTATKSNAFMPANSSPRQISEARSYARSPPYRLITYSKRDRQTRSRRTQSDSNSDEPIVISDSDDYRNSPSRNTRSKGKGKEKARMATPETFSDDDVVYVSGPSKPGCSRQTNSEANAAVETGTQSHSTQAGPSHQMNLQTDATVEDEAQLSTPSKRNILLALSVSTLSITHTSCGVAISSVLTALLFMAKLSLRSVTTRCRTVYGRFLPVESHTLQQQAIELRETLHRTQPERALLDWPVDFKPEKIPYRFSVRRKDRLF